MTTTMTMTTKTARLHAVWARLAALLALLLVLGVLAPQARAQTTSITFFHNDVLGSPAVATDANGAVVWKESYLPYGHRLQAPAAGANNKLWYAGKQLDPNTGLSYMGARYYSPVVGRFMGMDPKGIVQEDPHSFNRYAYANNNPYKYVDPDGRSPALVLKAGVTVLALAGAAGYLTPERQAQMGHAATLLRQRTGEALERASNWVFNESGESSASPQIHEGQQGKHVPGHNNFQPGKSELTDPDPQGLLDQGAGTGQQVGGIPLGQPGSKERVDFGKKIGNYVDPVTGEKSPTSIGIIHNGSRGSHIVPARPGQ